MNAATVMHRWCNKDFGRNNTLTASRSCHAEGRTYYSYSTVFGQWVDISKKVVLIYEGSTTPTSSKYKLCKSYFPDDVHVFPYDDGGYTYYNGCRLLSTWGTTDEDFTQEKRMELLDYYVQEMYEQFHNITTSKSKGAENVSFAMWEYFEKLCALYKDISVAKYLKTLKHIKQLKRNGEVFNKEKKEHIKKCNAEVDAKKVMVKLLAAGERNVETITDAMFGAGTYKMYWDYCARFRKADAKKKHLEALCERLRILTPYSAYRYSWNAVDCELSAAAIRKLTARERNEIHFRNLAVLEERNHRTETDEKLAKNHRNAYKWVVGFDAPRNESFGRRNVVHNVRQCRNMFTGEVYNMGSNSYNSMSDCLPTSIFFHCDEFCKSGNKEEWLRNFYAECKEVAENTAALEIMERVKAHKEASTVHSWREVYIADDYLRDNTTDEEYELCLVVLEKQQRAIHEEEVRQRMRRMERERIEEERRREEEYKKQVKREQIEECLKRGTEGKRDAWRMHFLGIYDVADKEEDFYHGGNVLLRFNLDHTRIETSMGIRISIAQAKQLWKLIQKWHNNPASFKECSIDTKLSGKYTAISYKNDILTAGCHKIAYAEMERMYNEIIAEAA